MPTRRPNSHPFAVPAHSNPGAGLTSMPTRRPNSHPFAVPAHSNPGAGLTSMPTRRPNSHPFAVPAHSNPGSGSPALTGLSGYSPSNPVSVVRALVRRRMVDRFAASPRYGWDWRGLLRRRGGAVDARGALAIG